MTGFKPIWYSLILPVLAAMALGVAACSGGGADGATQTTTVDPGTTSGGNTLASIDPCSLLTQDSVTSLKLIPDGPKNTSQSRGCSWSENGSYSVGIYVDGSQGIAALRDSNSTTVSLQSHDAIQTASSGIDCGLDIAVTATSSVSISVESVKGDPCQIATQYATLIEPKLPAQQK